MASMIADAAGVRGLVCLGYPLHPPGKPERMRVAHLRELRTPALFLQGTRDPFGGREEFEQTRLSAAIRVHFLEDGDHGFKPRASSGRTERQNHDEAFEVLLHFLTHLRDRAA